MLALDAVDVLRMRHTCFSFVCENCVFIFIGFDLKVICSLYLMSHIPVQVKMFLPNHLSQSLCILCVCARDISSLVVVFFNVNWDLLYFIYVFSFKRHFFPQTIHFLFNWIWFIWFSSLYTSFLFRFTVNLTRSRIHLNLRVRIHFTFERKIR